MNEYSMEELIPIVAKLTDKYTSKESTSVTYETARMLMEAVVYCIQEYEQQEDTSSVQRIHMDANAVYALGLQLVKDKVKRVNEAYLDLSKQFCAYGNINYEDTVQKAIPAFFLYYDPVFQPQNTRITMDYPVFCDMSQWCGIDAIEKYLVGIQMEQQFLQQLDTEYVYSVLSTYQRDYGTQYYNITKIVLHTVLASRLIEKCSGQMEKKEQYQRLHDIVCHNTKEELINYLKQELEGLEQLQGLNRDRMLEYMALDLDDFATELQHGAKHGVLINVVTLMGWNTGK